MSTVTFWQIQGIDIILQSELEASPITNDRDISNSFVSSQNDICGHLNGKSRALHNTFLLGLIYSGLRNLSRLEWHRLLTFCVMHRQQHRKLRPAWQHRYAVIFATAFIKIKCHEKHLVLLWEQLFKGVFHLRMLSSIWAIYECSGWTQTLLTICSRVHFVDALWMQAHPVHFTK